MALIEFEDLPSTDTPINSENLNYNFNECKIESGSNSNGNWIKYADGTMECYKTVSGSADISTSWGSLYISSYIDLGTMPQEFIARPTITYSPQSPTGTQFFLIGDDGHGSGSATNFGCVSLVRPNSRTGVNYYIDVTAKGKWK